MLPAKGVAIKRPLKGTHCKAPGQSPPEFIFDDAVGPESVRIGNVGAQEGFGARGAQNDVALETAAQLSPVPLLKRGICSTNIYSILSFVRKYFQIESH